jgi:hypothetical protein
MMSWESSIHTDTVRTLWGHNGHYLAALRTPPSSPLTCLGLLARLSEGEGNEWYQWHLWDQFGHYNYNSILNCASGNIAGFIFAIVGNDNLVLLDHTQFRYGAMKNSSFIPHESGSAAGQLPWVVPPCLYSSLDVAGWHLSKMEGWEPPMCRPSLCSRAIDRSRWE